MEEEMYFENEDRETIPKAVRHRKKQLYAAIREKMEFYFSDANLHKDRFLKQLVDTDPQIDLAIFLRFNRIQQLTSNVVDIAKALRKSELLHVTEDKTKVFRTTPIRQKDNEDACTIYVEQLTPDTDHDWVKNIFSKYGHVDYISIPKYRNSGKVKGFAFVEFALPEHAKAALEAFEKEGCCLTSNMDPQELCSIFTHEEQSASQAPEEAANSDAQADVGNTKNIKKRKLPDEEDIDSEVSKKKVKAEINEEAAKKEEGEKENEEEKEESSLKKKKNRKKKKSHKTKYANDVKSYGLHILSKTDWKRLRNKYLDLQRAKMKRLKQNLHRSQTSHTTPSYSTPSQGYPAATSQSMRPKTRLEHGAILKLNLAEPLGTDQQLAQFKVEAKGLEDVVYVDASLGGRQVYLRASAPEGAQNLLNNKSVKTWGSADIIQGEEEQAYWDKLMQDRKEKWDNPNKFKKRGREKLLSKAQKLVSKRIRLSVDE